MAATSRQGRQRPAMARRLAAILALDIHAYSLMMAGDEVQTHRRVNADQERLTREIGKSYGVVFHTAGDGLMAEFPSAVEATKCALRIQADAARRNAKLPDGERIAYRIGLHAGEIVVQAGRIGWERRDRRGASGASGQPGRDIPVRCGARAGVGRHPGAV